MLSWCSPDSSRSASPSACHDALHDVARLAPLCMNAVFVFLHNAQCTMHMPATQCAMHPCHSAMHHCMHQCTTAQCTNASTLFFFRLIVLCVLMVLVTMPFMMPALQWPPRDPSLPACLEERSVTALFSAELRRGVSPRIDHRAATLNSQQTPTKQVSEAVEN